MVAIYGIGLFACVFHLANGIWTMGITWGVWISPRAQSRMLVVCTLFGLLLAVVGLSGLFGMRAAIQGDGLEKVIDRENQIYLKKVETGAIEDNESNKHKRSHQEN